MTIRHISTNFERSSKKQNIDYVHWLEDMRFRCHVRFGIFPHSGTTRKTRHYDLINNVILQCEYWRGNDQQTLRIHFTTTVA